MPETLQEFLAQYRRGDTFNIADGSIRVRVLESGPQGVRVTFEPIEAKQPQGTGTASELRIPQSNH